LWIRHPIRTAPVRIGVTRTGTIQPAIDLAATKSGVDLNVLCAEGTYTPTLMWGGGTARHASFVMRDDVKLRGGYVGWNGGSPGSILFDDPDGRYNKTILSGFLAPGVNSYHVVVADSAFVFTGCTIDGFLITEGIADEPAGSSDEDKGGGLLNRKTETLVENVTFRNNEAISGGGAYNTGDKVLKIKLSTFRFNEADNGAGLYVANPSLKVELCNVRFRDNGVEATTTRGGGMYVEFECNIEAANCVFNDNEAGVAGGGVYVDVDDRPNATDIHEWRHCTFAFNSVALPVPPAVSGGAGMHYDPGHANATITLDNSILYSNINGSDLRVLGGTFTYSFCDIGNIVGGLDGGGNLSVDPLFVNPASGNFRLRGPTMILPWSPCLDVGSDTLIGPDFLDIDDDGSFALLPWDFDHRARQLDVPSVGGSDTVDMGAYEAPLGILE